jgi:cytoskeleton protein RodZ
MQPARGYSLMSFGNELKTAREAQELSIQDVAAKIKIRGEYLGALEEEQLSVLPERTFARAYLQTYARALNLDHLPMLREFDRLMPQPAEQVNHLHDPGGPQRLPSAQGRYLTGLVGSLIGGVLLLGVAGYFGYAAYTSRSTQAGAVQDSSVALPNTKQVRFTLSSTPSGARVYVDNSYLGLTPVKDFPLAPRAQATLRVEYGGRLTYKEAVVLQSDRNMVVNLPLLTAAQKAAQKADQEAAQKTAAAQAAQTANAAPAGTAQPTAVQPTPTQPAATPVGQAAPVPPTPTTTAPPAAPTAPTNGVRLSWAGASWTRVTGAGGRVLYQGIPKPGSSQEFPKGITVRTGSAGLVTATISGGQPQRMGAVGAVVTRTF